VTVYCCVCKSPVLEKRANRGSHFCSEQCHEQYRRARRDWRAAKACRLCGRSPARLKRKTVKQQALPTEHTGAQDLMNGKI
jgi:hypothetical protein